MFEEAYKEYTRIVCGPSDECLRAGMDSRSQRLRIFRICPLSANDKYGTPCARDDLEYAWAKQMFSKVFVVALYAQHDQIRAVCFGNFEDLARRSSMHDDANRFRPELRS
jgi:hypothetical protein